MSNENDPTVAGEALITDEGELFIDFDAIEELAPVPQGMYPAVITDATISAIQSGSNAGKPKITIAMAITSEPHVGRKVFRNYSLVSQAMWALRRLADATGLEGRVSVSDISDHVVGCDLAVSITHRSYMGEVRSNVQNVFPLAALESDSGSDDISSLFS